MIRSTRCKMDLRVITLLLSWSSVERRADNVLYNPYVTCLIKRGYIISTKSRDTRCWVGLHSYSFILTSEYNSSSSHLFIGIVMSGFLI